MQPPEGPPVWAALNCLPPGMPPPMSKMISRSVIPIGTSMRPVRAILPASAKTLVPFDFSVPTAAKALAPPETMAGTLAKVSTLLMRVGIPPRPLTAG